MPFSKVQTISSTNIRTIEYDPSRRIARVYFQNGGYEYGGIGASNIDKVKSEKKSLTSAVNLNIKNVATSCQKL